MLSKREISIIGNVAKNRFSVLHDQTEEGRIRLIRRGANEEEAVWFDTETSLVTISKSRRAIPGVSPAQAIALALTGADTTKVRELVCSIGEELNKEGYRANE